LRGRFDSGQKRIEEAGTPQQKILVAGSRRIQNNYNEISELAKAIGAKIMRIDNWVLLNGGASETSSEGNRSVDYLVCIGAQDKLRELGHQEVEERILTIHPSRADPNFFHKIGKVEVKGADLSLRRHELVKQADAIITIEGGIGTEDIIERGMRSKKPVLPIACTGDKSKKAWDDHEKDILQIFEIKKPSEEYRMLTTSKGLDRPSELSDFVIKIITYRLSRSLHNPPVHADNPSKEDLLGRRSFAKAIAGGMEYYLSSGGGDDGSFLVHIYGPWGSGKSTLLKFLEKELEAKWIVVNFNAWQHQRIGTPWWLLMDAVYRRIRQKTPPPFKWGIWIKENGWRLRNGWSRGFWLAALSSAIIAVAIFSGSINIESIQEATQSGGTISGLLAFFNERVVGGIMATIVSIITGIRAFGNSLLPGSPSAASQFEMKTADPMQKLQRHFKKMIGWTRMGWTRKKKPVAIFVDDLDRCREEYTVEFLEGIQTIFRDAPRLVFVIAADRRWLYSSYQKVYGSFSETFDKIGRPLGYLFLEKTFQISVALPKLSSYYQEAYLHYLVTLDKKEFEEEKKQAKDQAKDEVKAMPESQKESRLRSPTGEPIKDQGFCEAVVEDMFGQSEFKEKTENFLRKFSRFMEPNPRSMKRLVTAFGLCRAADILSGSYVDEDKLARWVIITQGWPLVANFLEEHPEIVDKINSKNMKEWEETLRESGVEERDRKMLLDPAIGNVLLGGRDVGKPLDSDTIRRLVSL
jgi:predicted Rossmann-fold nucleotide-binding protein